MTQRGWTPRAYLTIAQVVVALHGCSGTFDTPRGPTSLEGGDGDVETSEQAADGVSDTDEPPQSGDGDTNANDDALDAGDSSPGSAGETLDAGAGAGPVGAGDLPCDVASLLATYCVACHQQPPVAGAHVALLSASDLRASSPTRPGLTLGDEALARMQASDATRMPPGGARPTPAEVDAFAAWVGAGEPAGACGSLADAGVAQPDPAFSGDVVCSSGSFWTGGNEESPLMHPGYACIDCHESDEGPRFSLAGTVFATGHEPDDCDGSSDGAAVRIEVSDANGKTVALTPNRAGNFYSTASLAFPITARVLFEGRVRQMLTSVSSGDCNGCHTVDGAQNAPGRIALP